MPRDGDFSQATKLRIAQRSGYVCAFPDCLAPTSGPALDEGKAVNVGEAAHIAAASEGGPRYDPKMTPEERESEENGIWMCSTHASLIDRDTDRYTTDALHDLKWQAEERAMKLLGRPKGCSQGTLASALPAARLGAEIEVVVDGQRVPYAPIVDGGEEGASITWFVNAFAVQFSIQKKQNLKAIVVDHFVVTVHETHPVPKYQPQFGAYPAEVSLYYVEIDANVGKIRREFRPDRFYTAQNDDSPEVGGYPNPTVLDDDLPTQFALRINAKVSGKYLVSLDAVRPC